MLTIHILLTFLWTSSQSSPHFLILAISLRSFIHFCGESFIFSPLAYIMFAKIGLPYKSLHNLSFYANPQNTINKSLWSCKLWGNFVNVIQNTWNGIVGSASIFKIHELWAVISFRVWIDFKNTVSSSCLDFPLESSMGFWVFSIKLVPKYCWLTSFYNFSLLNIFLTI